MHFHTLYKRHRCKKEYQLKILLFMSPCYTIYKHAVLYDLLFHWRNIYLIDKYTNFFVLWLWKKCEIHSVKLIEAHHGNYSVRRCSGIIRKEASPQRQNSFRPRDVHHHTYYASWFRRVPPVLNPARRHVFKDIASFSFALYAVSFT